jgi:hypothetical protein
MHAGIRRYLTAVVDQEWLKNYNHEGVESADAALSEPQAVIWGIDAACQARARTERPCTNGLAIASFVKALDDRGWRASSACRLATRAACR